MIAVLVVVVSNHVGCVDDLVVGAAGCPDEADYNVRSMISVVMMVINFIRKTVNDFGVIYFMVAHLCVCR